jgi:hypothetical protein
LVIYRTLANRPIVRCTILATDQVTGSNHEVIEWELGVDRQREAYHGRVLGWNVVAMTEEDREAAEIL